MSRVMCLLKSDRLFAALVQAAIGIVVSAILFEALVATIHVAATGDPFNWKTFRTCPACGGLSHCDDPQASWYRCQKCGWSAVCREK